MFFVLVGLVAFWVGGGRNLLATELPTGYRITYWLLGGRGEEPTGYRITYWLLGGRGEEPTGYRITYFGGIPGH